MQNTKNTIHKIKVINQGQSVVFEAQLHYFFRGQERQKYVLHNSTIPWWCSTINESIVIPSWGSVFDIYEKLLNVE